MATTPALPPIGAGDSTLALPTNTNAPGSLDTAGKTFASLVSDVGISIAGTQQKLTEAAAATISDLAKIQVDVIAVQQTVYDDTGTIRASIPIKSKLPALALINPVAEEVAAARVKAEFRVSELVTSGKTSVSSSGSGFGGGIGLSLQPKAFSVGASGGFSSRSASSTVATQTDQASAVGQMRVFQRISSREISFPQPERVIVGPSITVLAADLKETTDADGTLTRTQSVLAQLRNRAGAPIEGKQFSIDTEGVPFAFVPDENAKQTNADGNVEISLTRTYPKPPDGAPPVDTTPRPVVVSFFLGILVGRTSISL